MKDHVFHQGITGWTSPNTELIIGVVIEGTSLDLAEITEVAIEAISPDLVATIGAEIEVKNQDLVVISLRLVQETVERNDQNSAVLTVEQIALSLEEIINLEIGVTNRGLAQTVAGEIDPNLAAQETTVTDPNLEIHQEVFQTKIGEHLVVAQEGRSKNQVKDLPVATAMAIQDLQVTEVIDPNLVGQKKALHQEVATALRSLEKGDLTNQGLQPHTKEMTLQNSETAIDLATQIEGATSHHLGQEVVERNDLNSEGLTAVQIVQNLAVLIVEWIDQSLVVVAELVNRNLRGKKENSTSLALSAQTHLNLPKNSISPKWHLEQDWQNLSQSALSQPHQSENTTKQQNKKERNILTKKNQKLLAFQKQTKQIHRLVLKGAKENLIAL